jgi:LAO/AO transport system kinase
MASVKLFLHTIARRQLHPLSKLWGWKRRMLSTLPSSSFSSSSSATWEVMNDKTRELATSMASEDSFQRRLGLARAVTLMETKNVQKKQQGDYLLTYLLQQQQEENPADASLNFRIGLAGPPGSGKSTMVEALGRYILDELPTKTTITDANNSTYEPERLAVVCIDPSSSISGGSILGDKTRMTELSRHPRAFVRPSANSGVVGGLAAYTDDVVSTCHAAGYPLVLVETVGLGQSEIEVAQSVDMLILLLPPGGGDGLQGVKKGIMEVSNLFCVTKADGNLSTAARHTAADYQAAIAFLSSMGGGDHAGDQHKVWRPPVLLTSAVTGDGLDQMWESICSYRKYLQETGILEKQRQKQAQYWMWKQFQNLVQDKTRQDPRLAQTSEQLQEALRRHQLTPRVAAKNLLETLFPVD